VFEQGVDLGRLLELVPIDEGREEILRFQRPLTA
jgi:hypothetical protein